MELAFSIMGMGALGYGLDHWLGTKPLWLLAGLGLGFLGGGYNFIRQALALGRAAAADVPKGLGRKPGKEVSGHGRIEFDREKKGLEEGRDFGGHHGAGMFGRRAIEADAKVELPPGFEEDLLQHPGGDLDEDEEVEPDGDEKEAR